MKNYLKWIMLFLYLVAIGAVVNYYTAKYEEEKKEKLMNQPTEDDPKIDSLTAEPILEDSLMRQNFDQTKKRIEGGY